MAFCIEQNIQLVDNIIINKNNILELIKKSNEYSDKLKNIFVDISEDMVFWLDLASSCHLPFYIFNNLQDFTQELEYTNLIPLCEMVNTIVCDYSSCRSEISISKKMKLISTYYNFDEKDTSRLIISANLHNIGKLFISADILNKNDKLPENEFDIVKSIPYFTSLIIQQIFGFDDINQLASTYCEKLNGRGYPYRLKANQLSLKNRILAIFIIYQALTEDRSYRKAYSHEDAMELIKEDIKAGKLDNSVGDDFEKVFKRD